ncbi:MAG: CDP-alcohol phosphatidyltransferase family protein [Clostridiales bacterium]|nr:CDP-alcohol phosphatidyltransferase family protein [Clostridiales bacterium]
MEEFKTEKSAPISQLPNALSLARMPLALIFITAISQIFMYGCDKNWILIVLYFAIIASDIADGYLARRLGCASSFGAKLDIASDAVYSLLTLAAFAYFQVIPAWFLIVMALKLAEFAVTSRLASKAKKPRMDSESPNAANSQNALEAQSPKPQNPKPQNPKPQLLFDKLGKLSVCIVMLMPGLFVFRCIVMDYKYVMNVMIYALTFMLVASFVNRIAKLRRIGG